MPGRRKLWLLVALTVAVPILAVAAFIFRYDLAGRVRGEASYKGKYTCEWRAEIQRLDPCPARRKNRIVRHWLPPDRGMIEKLFVKVFGATAMPEEPGWPLLDRDPAAIPVLLELARDSNPVCRLFAADAFLHIGPEAKAGITRLVETVEDDPNPAVKDAARQALNAIDPDTYSYLVQ